MSKAENNGRRAREECSEMAKIPVALASYVTLGKLPI